MNAPSSLQKLWGSRPPPFSTISPDSDNHDRDAPNNEQVPFWRIFLTTVGICLAVFCMSLDNTIIATAIPRITEQFDSLGGF
jgi:hypothetical protein